jgi:hypothetical protein
VYNNLIGIKMMMNTNRFKVSWRFIVMTMATTVQMNQRWMEQHA